jgi:hypothetical protein
LLLVLLGLSGGGAFAVATGNDWSEVLKITQASLAYVPASDLKYFLPAMRRYRQESHPWYANVDQ